MRIAVIGAGYAGLISAVGWAGMGHDVTCIDRDHGKIAAIARGVPPFSENGLAERLREALGSGRLRASASCSGAAEADVIFIVVGSPSLPDGSLDVSAVKAASESVAEAIRGAAGYRVVAVRSTVLPGTTEGVVAKALAGCADFGLAMVPEFLREGTALEDFDRPERIVMGCPDARVRGVLEELHAPFSCPKVFVDIRTAEMIKYASNAFLASRIALVNETANLCHKMGIDVDQVMKGVGMDSRIGRGYSSAGAGFGGSCLPKDVSALAFHARKEGVDVPVLHAILESNKRQCMRLFEMLSGEMNPAGRQVAVLGLSFKPGTDDIRESPALPLIGKLLEAGASVRAHDPVAMEIVAKRFPAVNYAKSFEECVAGCDAAIIVTAWPEYVRSAAEYRKLLGDAILLDARRTIPPGEAEKAGLAYHAIGRGRR